MIFEQKSAIIGDFSLHAFIHLNVFFSYMFHSMGAHNSIFVVVVAFFTALKKNTQMKNLACTHTQRGLYYDLWEQRKNL